LSRFWIVAVFVLFPRSGDRTPFQSKTGFSKKFLKVLAFFDDSLVGCEVSTPVPKPQLIMQDPETTSQNETVEEPVNYMDAWNYLHQKMWEQVELERQYAERFDKEFTLDHPEKIFGPNALKTPWDKDCPAEELTPEEFLLATLKTTETIVALDLGQVIEAVLPEPPIVFVPQGWEVVETSVPEEEQPVAEVKPKAKSKSKKKKD